MNLAAFRKLSDKELLDSAEGVLNLTGLLRKLNLNGRYGPEVRDRLASLGCVYVPYKQPPRNSSAYPQRTPEQAKWASSFRREALKTKFIQEVLPLLFIKNSPFSGKRARRFIRNWNKDFGWLEEICEICRNSGVWLGKPLVLQIDHKNGDSSDHRIKNLRFLCPNCHAQTETFTGKAIGLKAKGKVGD